MLFLGGPLRKDQDARHDKSQNHARGSKATERNAAVVDRFVESWLAVNTERLIARARIHESLAHQNHYTVDRLVGAANAFDQLPESAAPRRMDLTPGVLSAKQQCKKVFRDLPASDEREFLFALWGDSGRLRSNKRYAIALKSSQLRLPTSFPHWTSFATEPSNAATISSTAVRFAFNSNTHPAIRVSSPTHSNSYSLRPNSLKPAGISNDF